MKKFFLIAVPVCALITIASILIFQTNLIRKPSYVSNKTIVMKSGPMPFSDAIEKLSTMLRGENELRLEALMALEGQPQIVANSPLLAQITRIAIQDEDYSRLSAFINEQHKQDIDTKSQDKALLALGERAAIRQIALAIAVANGDPEAIKKAKQLAGSKNIAEQEIAKNSIRWLDLHGTPNAPKPDPLLYGTRVVPFEKFVADVSSDISSGDEKKQIASISYVIRNLEMKQVVGQPREALVGLLKSYIEKSTANPGSEGYSLKLEAVRSASLAGGPTAKALLVQLANSGDTPISEDAARALADFSALHPEEK